MATSLEEEEEAKTAFFNQLAALNNESDVDEEDLKFEQHLRKTTRKYFEQTRKRSPRKPTPAADSRVPTPAKRPLRQPERTASAPTPGTAATTSRTVIESSPDVGTRGKKVQAGDLSFIEDTPLQDLAPGAKQTLRRSSTNPLRNSTLARTLSDQSPCVTPSMTGKRKRNSTDKIVQIPESEQILRGLSLFYVPDNDVNKVRKERINRARGYGAEWTRHILSATHVIIDKNLRYQDVESVVAPVAGKASVSIVNEDYPLDCIRFRTILPTGQARFQVKGSPAIKQPSAPSPPVEPEVSQRSLQLKAPRNSRAPPPATPSEKYTQPNSVGQSQHEPSNALNSSQGEWRDTSEPVIPSSQEFQGGRAESSRPSSPDPNDELSQLIQLVQQDYKDLPPIGDEDADEQDVDSKAGSADDDNTADVDSGSGSEGEREKEKKRARNTSSAKKNTSFEDRFACNRGGTKDKTSDHENPNARTIEILQQMLDYYSKTNDTWRIQTYRKVIGILKKQTVKIATKEQAMELYDVGPRLGAKIEEIVNTDRLQRLEHALNDPMSEVLSRFMGIYSVGQSTAEKWIAKGYRTLDDLREKAHLSPNQQIGIDHYEDLNTRIPRREVEALGAYVRRHAGKIDRKVELLIGGSYRRGADSSGDIDFIVTKKGTTSSGDLKAFLDELVAVLTKKDFLVASLATSHSDKDCPGSKWHGCCVLPRMPGTSNDNDDYRPIWRRIDILLVPETEYGAALIYFTGNDIFNRSIRLLASRKEMRLNQRGLYKHALRGPGRVKIAEGELVEGRDEKRIFEVLGVKWRAPDQRWC